MTEEIKKEIEGLQARYDQAWRGMIHLEGQIFRLKCKLNAIDPEEGVGIRDLIGSNLPDKPWQNAHATYKETGE